MRKITIKILGVFLLVIGMLMALGCIAYTARIVLSGFDIFNSEASKITQLELRTAQVELGTAQTKLASQKELTIQTLTELDIWREKEIFAGRDVEMEYALARDKLLASAAQILTRQDRVHVLMQTATIGLAFIMIGLTVALLGWIIYVKQQTSVTV